MTTNAFMTAVQAKDWAAAAELVWSKTKSDCTRQEIRDYVEEGSYIGTETAESVAAEYDELNMQVEGVDY